jgi:serine/threonine protein kinase
MGSRKYSTQVDIWSVELHHKLSCELGQVTDGFGSCGSSSLLHVPCVLCPSRSSHSPSIVPVCRSVGCIFAEMVNGRPLFPGSSEQDQLVKIFKSLGTPTPKTWPQMADLPEYKATFQHYPPQSFKKIVRKLDPIGLDLLTRMLQYDPNKRLSAEQAMKHRQWRSGRDRRNNRWAWNFADAACSCSHFVPRCSRS